MAKRKTDPVECYARAVADGKVPACLLTRLACERHLRDLKTAPMRGLRWDWDAAEHALRFFQFLRHSKGEWAGCRFELEPWQQFIVGSLFGWKRADGTRRFRVAYIEVPRKNGKSTLSAGIGLYLLVGDGEAGAEVYAAATKKDQARIVWDEAAAMVRRSPDLAKRIRVLPGKGNMHVLETRSKFEPLGADTDRMDGLNVHGAIVDELHAHRTRDVWDVLDTATGARRQPLIFAITTAGTDQTSVCYEQHQYAEQVLNRTIEDDNFFAFITTIDEEDDWADPAAWAKANPNLGISAKVDDLKRKCETAKQLPAAQNAFLRLHLNVWTQQVTRWIDLDMWDENAGLVVEEKLAGRVCFGGLDLSSVSDLTAWVMVFPRENDAEELDVLARFWCPEARIHDRHNKYRQQYRVWAERGLIKATPGDAIDYDFVVKQVLDDAQKFQLVDLNIDRLFQAHQVAVKLMDELGENRVVGMGQGFLSMAAPMKEFERRLLARKIHHGGNPVLRWMAANVAVKQDPAGNLKPDKASSQGKIDGIVALVMALDRAMRHGRVTGKSVYEKRGVVAL